MRNITPSFLNSLVFSIFNEYSILNNYDYIIENSSYMDHISYGYILKQNDSIFFPSGICYSIHYNLIDLIDGSLVPNNDPFLVDISLGIGPIYLIENIEKKNIIESIEIMHEKMNYTNALIYPYTIIDFYYNGIYIINNHSFNFYSLNIDNYSWEGVDPKYYPFLIFQDRESGDIIYLSRQLVNHINKITEYNISNSFNY
ncbi:MAG: hypothetical protein MUC62_08005 [Candidatus Thermoplasmatota archaeon]|nr:hypothetical protein [Candidatus Thermoplasmatota archaeon]